jgi:RNA polymerase sigma factor (sigma-70 family)
MLTESSIKNLSDLEIIQKLKKETNKDTLLTELVSRHSGIYIDIINHYVPPNSRFTNKDELINDKNYNIYNAALKYDPTRGAKFSTYLGNETKWMCLNIYNKQRRNPEVTTEAIILDLNQDFSINEHEKHINRELLNKIMEIVGTYSDDRISKIFTMRYIEGQKNKVMPWKSVSESIDMSIQGCINIHDSTIKKLQIKLKEI